MFGEKNIIVTIGNYGAVVALHQGNEIKNKIFLDELTETVKADLRDDVFHKNKSAPIYVLLDTIDQSYKKKIYPSVRKSDLTRIIQRDMASDGDKESIKNYILLNPKKNPVNVKQPSSARWECLFISSSNSEVINHWIEFLLDMPNRLVGIYMLPIETFSLFKLIKENVRIQAKLREKKNNICCLVMQNKVSGIRQVAFSEQGIIFTRVVNYNFDKPDFLEKYEQDIYSTFEYLKRLFPDLSIDELDIVNILPAEVIDVIKKISNIELHFVNYTPYQITSLIGQKDLIPSNSNYCDLVISKVFSKQKKILKFTTPKIKILEKFFMILRSSYYANLILILGICATFLFTIFSENKIGESIDLTETEKLVAIQDFARLKKITLAGMQGIESIDLEKAIDLGKLQEAFSPIGMNFTEFYIKLKFLKEFDIKLNNFTYSLEGVNGENPTSQNNYRIAFKGDIFNKSGDIEDLFREFDTVVLEVKKNFPQNQIKYSELPRNIDFSQKYYSFPVDFTITK
jgi:hypothetical protein